MLSRYSLVDGVALPKRFARSRDGIRDIRRAPADATHDSTQLRRGVSRGVAGHGSLAVCGKQFDCIFVKN
jgi:hypothetical protein